MSVADKLKQAGGSGGKGADFPPARRIKEFDGQTLTVVSIKKVPSKLAKSGFSILATALDAEGNDVTFWTTPNSGNQLAAIEQDLPQDLTVESFDTDYGQKGYKFTLA